jgi:hypothetical protein
MSGPNTKGRTSKGPSIALEARRERVLELALQHYTLRTIARMMTEDGIKISLSMVHSDLSAAKAERAKENDTTIATQQMKLQLVQKRGWDDGEMDTVLNAIKEENKLLGLYPAEKHRLDIPGLESLFGMGASGPKRMAIGNFAGDSGDDNTKTGGTQ